MLFNTTVLINAILTNYFQHFYCVFLISDNTFDFTFFKTPVVIYKFSGLVNKCDNFNVTSSDLEKSFINFNNFCEGFIIFTQHPQCVFNKVEEQLRTDIKSPYKFNNRKYLFLLDEDVNTNEIYKSVHLKNVPATFIIKSIEEQMLYYKIYTIINKGPNDYKEILLDKWFLVNDTFMYNKNLFPDKTKNLQGMKISIAAVNFNPYAILRSSYFDSYGIEMRLIQEFIRRHNATPELKMIMTEDWGAQDDNDTKPTGLSAEIIYNNVDLGFGGYTYSYYSYHLLDFAKPHYSSLLKVMVPKPKLLTQIPLAFYPFSYKMWILIAITYITSIIILFLASTSPKFKATKSKLSNLNITILNVFGVYLQQPHNLYRIVQNHKIAIISTFGMSLLMSMLYNSGMSSLITVPRYEKPIKKFTDFIKSDVRVGTTSLKDNLILVVNSESEVDKEIIKHFVEYNLTVLEEITVKNDIGRLTEITTYGSYAINGISRNGLKKLQVMDDGICYYHLLFNAKKNFPLMSTFNKFVGRVTESGLIKFWENEAIFLNTTITLQNIIKFSTYQEPQLQKLHFEQVAGAFIMLLVGLSLAIIAFICENVIFNYL